MELNDNEIVITDDVSGRRIIVDNDNWIASEEKIEYYFVNYVDGGKSALYDIRNRASIEEVLEFANNVRKAGGGQLIDGLFPSIPQEPTYCLIANALNFDCEVNLSDGVWTMDIDDNKLGAEIGQKMNLTYDDGSYVDYVDDETGEEVIDYEGFCSIELPHEIGIVAGAFDSCVDYELEEFNQARNNS